MAKAKSKSRLNLGYGAIYQRKTKSGISRFYLEFYDASGKRKQVLDKNAATWDEATSALKSMVLREHSRKYGLEQKNKDIGFKEFAQIYLQDYIMAVRRGWRSDKYRLQKLEEYFKNDRLREVTPLSIEKFRASRLQQGNSRSTVNRYMALLKKMSSLAISEGFVTENPVKMIKLFREGENPKERVLTREEEDRLLGECSKELRPVVLMALHTGMRKGEILGLRWADIDFKRKVTRVDKTKSGKSRIIPLNSLLLTELRDLHRQDGKGERVFPFKSMRTAFENACRRAGLKLRFHDLRHTFASRLVASGVDLITVQSLLGHSTVLVTQRYTHSNDDRKRRAVELLGKDGEIGKNLLHGCYTEGPTSPKNLPTGSFSVN